MNVHTYIHTYVCMNIHTYVLRIMDRRRTTTDDISSAELKDSRAKNIIIMGPSRQQWILMFGIYWIPSVNDSNIYGLGLHRMK